MLLTAFSKGILGKAGRQVRFTSPATVEEALRIAVTVSKAEILEARDSAFYLDAEVAIITPAGRVREIAMQHTAVRQSAGSAAQSRKRSRVGQYRLNERASSGNGQPNKPVKCYVLWLRTLCALLRESTTETDGQQCNPKRRI
jgi:hypothetical protein